MMENRYATASSSLGCVKMSLDIQKGSVNDLYVKGMPVALSLVLSYTRLPNLTVATNQSFYIPVLSVRGIELHANSDNQAPSGSFPPLKISSNSAGLYNNNLFSFVHYGKSCKVCSTATSATCRPS